MHHNCKWAGAQQNLQNDEQTQRRLRPACLLIKPHKVFSCICWTHCWLPGITYMSINAKQIKVTSFYKSGYFEVNQNNSHYEGTLNMFVLCRNSRFGPFVYSYCMTVSLIIPSKCHTSYRMSIKFRIMLMSTYAPTYITWCTTASVTTGIIPISLFVTQTDFICYPCRCPHNRSPSKILPLPLPLGRLEDYEHWGVHSSRVDSEYYYSLAVWHNKRRQAWIHK